MKLADMNNVLKDDIGYNMKRRKSFSQFRYPQRIQHIFPAQTAQSQYCKH